MIQRLEAVQKPLKAYTRDFGRPELNWNLTEGIKEHGIRNAAQNNNCANWNNLSTVAGIEGLWL